MKKNEAFALMLFLYLLSLAALCGAVHAELPDGDLPGMLFLFFALPVSVIGNAAIFVLLALRNRGRDMAPYGRFLPYRRGEPARIAVGRAIGYLGLVGCAAVMARYHDHPLLLVYGLCAGLKLCCCICLFCAQEE